MPQSNRKPYPFDIYVVYDNDMRARLYTKDPLKQKDGGNGPCYTFDELLLEFMDNRPSTLMRPYLLRFMIYEMNRGDLFDITVPEQIRRKEIDAHIEDVDGNTIEITQRHSTDPEYFLNAIVYDSEGVIVETRRYAPTGECSDKEDRHHLVVLPGLADFEKKEENEDE